MMLKKKEVREREIQTPRVYRKEKGEVGGGGTRPHFYFVKKKKKFSTCIRRGRK